MGVNNIKHRFPLSRTCLAAVLLLLADVQVVSAAEPIYRRCNSDGNGLGGAGQWYYVAGAFKPSEQSKLDATLAMLQPFTPEVIRADKAAGERWILVGGDSDKEKLRTRSGQLLAAGLYSSWIVACEPKSQSAATYPPAIPVVQLPPSSPSPASALEQARITKTLAAAPTLEFRDDGLPVETLKDVVKRALETNPEIALAAANRRATEEEVAEAKAFNLPVIDARIAGGPEQSKNASTLAAVNDNRNLTRREAGLTLRQNLYDGGQISGEVERQKARLGAFASRETESRETTAFRVADAYLEVLRNEDLLKLAEDNLKAHREILVKSKDRFTSGAGNKADFQLAEGRTALANATVVIRQGALQESRAKYRRVVSSLPARLVKPEPIASLPISVEMASEMGVASNASIATLRDELTAAKAASINARGRLAPLVDVELAANNNRDTGGVPGPNNNASALLVMRYNLYRGGGDEAKIRQTVERETAATEALNNAKRAIEEEVSKAWHSMIAARDAQRYYETHVQMTTEVLDSFRSQFDIGKRTMLDLMNSENELFQAKSTRTAGQYNLLLAQHRLLAGMGGLLATLGL